MRPDSACPMGHFSNLRSSNAIYQTVILFYRDNNEVERSKELYIYEGIE